jgi:pyruvate ferredoxin oxidoreductase gamma subunit
MYSIRFHGRGGHGIKTASRILGNAFFLAGFEVQDAPRYGAERRGAPMSAYVRASHEPILERGIIRRADLIIVADDSLVPIPAAGVLAGIQPHTVLLIRSALTAETWRERLHLSNPTLVLPVADTMADGAELPLLGTTCAGAAASLLGMITARNLEEAIRTELEELGEEIVKANVRRARAAYDYFQTESGIVKEGAEVSVSHYEKPGWIDMPFDEASVSAPVIYGSLTSVEVKTGLWRTLRPVIDCERCHRCVWVCGSFCPDSAIVVNREGYPEIDYDHCKGCMICLAQCPSHAITAVPEMAGQSADTAKAKA